MNEEKKSGFSLIFAGAVGAVTAALAFYAMGQRIRIMLLHESLEAHKAVLARPGIAMFTEDQVKSLAGMLKDMNPPQWKN